MSETPLSIKDYNYIETYGKLFVKFAVEIIWSSRTFRKLKTHCGNDKSWFNISLAENRLAAEELKNVLIPGKQTGVNDTDYTLKKGLLVIFEIVLKDKRNDLCSLEKWEFAVNQQTDSNTKSSQHIYYKVSALLRSLLVVAYALPARRIAISSNYELLFRLSKEPIIDNFGSRCVEVDVATLRTPNFGISLKVTYRTSLSYDGPIIQLAPIDLYCSPYSGRDIRFVSFDTSGRKYSVPTTAVEQKRYSSSKQHSNHQYKSQEDIEKKSSCSQDHLRRCSSDVLYNASESSNDKNDYSTVTKNTQLLNDYANQKHLAQSSFLPSSMVNPLEYTEDYFTGRRRSTSSSSFSHRHRRHTESNVPPVLQEGREANFSRSGSQRELVKASSERRLSRPLSGGNFSNKITSLKEHEITNITIPPTRKLGGFYNSSNMCTSPPSILEVSKTSPMGSASSIASTSPRDSRFYHNLTPSSSKTSLQCVEEEENLTFRQQHDERQSPQTRFHPSSPLNRSSFNRTSSKSPLAEKSSPSSRKSLTNSPLAITSHTSTKKLDSSEYYYNEACPHFFVGGSPDTLPSMSPPVTYTGITSSTAASPLLAGNKIHSGKEAIIKNENSKSTNIGDEDDNREKYLSSKQMPSKKTSDDESPEISQLMKNSMSRTPGNVDDDEHEIMNLENFKFPAFIDPAKRKELEKKLEAGRKEIEKMTLSLPPTVDLATSIKERRMNRKSIPMLEDENAKGMNSTVRRVLKFSEHENEHDFSNKENVIRDVRQHDDNDGEDQEIVDTLDNIISEESPNARYVLIELKTPFSAWRTPKSTVADIGEFYKECQSPPRLEFFSSNVDEDENKVQNKLRETKTATSSTMKKSSEYEQLKNLTNESSKEFCQNDLKSTALSSMSSSITAADRIKEDLAEFELKGSDFDAFVTLLVGSDDEDSDNTESSANAVINNASLKKLNTSPIVKSSSNNHMTVNTRSSTHPHSPFQPILNCNIGATTTCNTMKAYPPTGFHPLPLSSSPTQQSYNPSSFHSAVSYHHHPMPSLQHPQLITTLPTVAARTSFNIISQQRPSTPTSPSQATPFFTGPAAYPISPAPSAPSHAVAFTLHPPMQPSMSYDIQQRQYLPHQAFHLQQQDRPLISSADALQYENRRMDSVFPVTDAICSPFSAQSPPQLTGIIQPQKDGEN